MADTGTKLQLSFLDGDGNTITKSWSYANTSASGTDVAALMDGMIAQGEAIYYTPPVSKVSAEFVQTETTDIATYES